MGQAWGYGRHGGPEVQELFDRPDPVPGRGEVLIRVEVAGVNPLDHLLRSGLVSGLDGGRPFPRVLGMEAAGTVLARGEDVDGLEVGDAVFGFALTGGGTYAETTVLSAPNTARIPGVCPRPWRRRCPWPGRPRWTRLTSSASRPVPRSWSTGSGAESVSPPPGWPSGAGCG